MSTAEQSATDQERIGSVVGWLRTLLGTFVATTLVVGLLVLVASLPALLILPRFGALSASFGWVAVVGVFLPFLNPTLDETEAEALEKINDTLENSSRVEKFFYATSFLFVLVFALSSLVFVSGITAAYLSTWTGIGLLGLGVAIFYPYLDIWLGNHLGWNIATTGGILVVIPLYLAALGYQTKTDIPQQAVTDARSFMLGH